MAIRCTAGDDAPEGSQAACIARANPSANLPKATVSIMHGGAFRRASSVPLCQKATTDVKLNSEGVPRLALESQPRYTPGGARKGLQVQVRNEVLAEMTLAAPPLLAPLSCTISGDVSKAGWFLTLVQDKEASRMGKATASICFVMHFVYTKLYR